MEDEDFEGEENFTEIAHPSDDEQDEHNEEDHDIGIEEFNFFEQGRNASMESLAEALDDINRTLVIFWAQLHVRDQQPAQTATNSRYQEANQCLQYGYMYPLRVKSFSSFSLLGSADVTTFSSSMRRIIWYLANYNQVSPIYCERSFQEARPWTGQLMQLGWLIVPGERDTTHLHELFTATPTGSTYISVITPTCCRANARGIPMSTWLLQELLNASVQFSYAPFPDGYLPPIVTSVQQPMYDVLPPANSSALDNMLSDVLLAPAFDLTPTEFQELNCGYNYWELSTITSLSGIDDTAQPFLDQVDELDEVDGVLTKEPVLEVFHPDLQWRQSKGGVWDTLNRKQRESLTCAMKKTFWWRIMMLTRASFVGGLWVGERQNPTIHQVEVRHRVTNSFLTALHLTYTTYKEMLEQPVVITFANGVTVSAGWPEFHRNQLAKAFNESKGELRKVIKGAMSPYTNFCDSFDTVEMRITHFVGLFNSNNINDVRQMISELIREHVFSELLWVSLFHPNSKLADRKCSVRLADFLPEEVFSDFTCLAQKPVGNLMMLLYQLMVITLKEREALVIDYCGPEDMNEIIMSALDNMGSNVLPIAPKSGLPRITTEETGKRFRNMTDILPIETQPISDSCIVVPNSGGFCSTKSLRLVSDVLASFFSTLPVA
ncbi:uncharacterized protein F5891DRAFT_985161 [Suillus fuscotomentosus]|uniref:Uncharacterized protein n=1 Tax=Suillus fuscotomentosus TaxID=1912939 RepID=A0AAD4DX83_9AGAM|nr:uncharacterized protein F5891DRAFT_985161 [Suillus fuscotomentosus]KAG1894273.1 hypothetical protein F5891DRAFT_985161 [Suillus fuscotomentosus]